MLDSQCQCFILVRVWRASCLVGGLQVLWGFLDGHKSSDLYLAGIICSCLPFWGWVWMFLFYGEFDPGSGRTLVACLTHASRTVKLSLLGGSVANG